MTNPSQPVNMPLPQTVTPPPINTRTYPMTLFLSLMGVTGGEVFNSIDFSSDTVTLETTGTPTANVITA
jgi:hypothetical protein